MGFLSAAEYTHTLLQEAELEMKNLETDDKPEVSNVDPQYAHHYLDIRKQ